MYTDEHGTAWYRDAEELAAASALVAPAYHAENHRHWRSKRAHLAWTGGTPETGLRALRSGLPDLVSEASALFDSLENLTSPANVWVRSPAGAFPVVPEALAGMMDPMRTRTKQASSFAPVRIVCGLGLLAAVDRDAVRARGIAAVALANALSLHRQVELVAAHCNDKCKGIAWTVGHSPINLSAALGQLASAPVVRCLLYALQSKRLNRPDMPGRSFDSDMYRRVMGFSASDVVIGGLLRLPQDMRAFVQAELDRVLALV